MLGYRLVHNESLLKSRSFCPHCKKTIAWYDLVPVFSWFWLRRKCRNCSQSISFVYPVVELFSIALFTLLYYLYSQGTVSGETAGAYTIFFSALLITIRSDTDYLLISQYATLYCIPLGLLFSFLGWLPLTVPESIAGACAGYALLWLTAKLFYVLRKKEGLGQGDLELLALIGSFLGVMPMIHSLYIGSCIGSLIGILSLYLRPQKTQLLPFGLFLSLGAIISVLRQIIR